MEEELYVFKCYECEFIFAEPYDPSDRYSRYPQCPDCGSNDVEMYGGDDIPEDIEKAMIEYIKKKME